MPTDLYLAYLLACVVIIIVPGPNVSMVIANSLAHGTRAGLLNVAGTQVGLAMILAVLALGLASVVESAGFLFDWLRLAGAAYLVWIGLKMIRASGTPIGRGEALKPRGGFFVQGVLVSLSNPKTLLFFGAFIPQFIDPARGHAQQVMLLGGTFIAIAAVLDGAYAVLVGRAGAWLSAKRVKLVTRLSGTFLVGGGVWLALSRAR